MADLSVKQNFIFRCVYSTVIQELLTQNENKTIAGIKIQGLWYTCELCKYHHKGTGLKKQTKAVRQLFLDQCYICEEQCVMTHACVNKAYV